MANIVESRVGKQTGRYAGARAARRALRRIYGAAVDAVKPSALLGKKVKISGNAVVVATARGRRRFALGEKIYLVGVGKGADLAAPVWQKLLGRRLAEGIFIVRDRIVRARIKRVAVVAAGHPLPDRRGLRATRRCLAMLSRAGSRDSVVVFLMGGASSLLVAPAGGLTLADKRAATGALLRSGANIAATNCVRKHLSAVKGGGLLRAARPARVLTLAISDVIGDDPGVIGSAPSFHDPTTFAQAWKILQRRGLANKIPRAVKNHLRRGRRGEVPETVKPGSPLARRSRYVVIAGNGDGLAAAKKKAESLGFAATIVTARLSGDARTRARAICRKLKSFRRRKNRRARPRCFLIGGETTVKVKGKGSGGRNQEFALASALALDGCRGIHLLAAASDGSDGPTDAAGAFVDGNSLARARRLGLDARRALRANDSYRFFAQLGDHFKPGPTGTNVMDFIIALAG